MGIHLYLKFSRPRTLQSIYFRTVCSSGRAMSDFMRLSVPLSVPLSVLLSVSHVAPFRVNSAFLRAMPHLMMKAKNGVEAAEIRASVVYAHPLPIALIMG